MFSQDPDSVVVVDGDAGAWFPPFSAVDLFQRRNAREARKAMVRMSGRRFMSGRVGGR